MENNLTLNMNFNMFYF